MATTRTIRPAADWQAAGEYEDIRYEIADGIAKITIDRPEVRNAFRPETLIEISQQSPFEPIYVKLKSERTTLTIA